MVLFHTFVLVAKTFWKRNSATFLPMCLHLGSFTPLLPAFGSLLISRMSYALLGVSGPARQRGRSAIWKPATNRFHLFVWRLFHVVLLNIWYNIHILTCYRHILYYTYCNIAYIYIICLNLLCKYHMCRIFFWCPWWLDFQSRKRWLYERVFIFV